MARGRMLSATISESKKFGNVQTNTSRLVYLMLLPWVDREGRYEADATLISHRVLMRCGIPEEQVEEALTDLERCGLIRLYSAQGKRVLEFVDFLKWNKPHWKEPPSALPDPSENGSLTQSDNVSLISGEEGAKLEPSLRQSPTAEVEVEVEEEVEEEEDLVLLSAKPTRVNAQAFVDTWNEHRGHLPSVQSLNRKRRDGIARLVKEHDGDALALFGDATLAVAGDEYWVEHQYGFDNLLRPGRVLEKAEKFRAGGTQLGSARIRMLSRAERWATALPDDGGS